MLASPANAHARAGIPHRAECAARWFFFRHPCSPARAFQAALFTICPAPWQAGHCALLVKNPCWYASCPRPAHVFGSLTRCPFFRPCAVAGFQNSWRGSVILVVRPAEASSKVSVMSVAQSESALCAVSCHWRVAAFRKKSSTKEISEIRGKS